MFTKKTISVLLAATALAAGMAYANPQGRADQSEPAKVDPMDQQFDIALSHYESGNYPKSFELAFEAAKKGHANSQMLVGTMYKDGSGTEQSFADAKAWYEQAAKQGHVLAQFHVGVMYEQGLGTPQNFEQALTWYGNAGELGFNYAQFNLGMMVLQGRGIESNPVVARDWFSRSCKNGIQMGCEAAELLGGGAPGKESM